MSTGNERGFPHVKTRTSWVVHLTGWLNEKGVRSSQTFCGLWASKESDHWINVDPPLRGGLHLCLRCSQDPRVRGVS